MEQGEAAAPVTEERSGEEEDDFGYRLFPDRDKKPQSFLARSLFTFHNRCQLMLRMTLETNPYAQLLLEAMKQSGCTVFNDRHFSCENCDGCVSGGFDSATSQIVLCQNNIRQQAHMNRVVAHELIHAFDHCRAHVDWFKNVKHLACSEIRAANLSGDCTVMNEIARFKFGLKGHHQTCVRDRAIRSILAVRKVSKETAEKAVDEVFDACFNDLEPFGRIPHSKKDAKRAYRDFQNRDRYNANL
ncbi:Mitochondrial inner membrane protease ATP23 [Mesitornis unicolor]|uniref:Mitochondrial inner membrane protease ATP23 n=1 Tax=Mesitornis unicolor TaxID=54374 RepID=A0A091RPA2_9AVES|nr:PREDICTED: mitochondrial inner membrane protease ATP23 homolog isoform X1 [Mesitornis unicolor]KFQ40774.1 Mitochondrial inner membrane protease ATP23 [Mesitornis unicolor]